MKKIIASERTLIMGVINLTEDSFYKGSRVDSLSGFDEMVSKMLKDGADILDLGAMSSRPGAKIIDQEEELKRIKPYFLALRDKHPNVFISIDTVHASVAAFCLEHGANMINDISAGSIDKELLPTISKHDTYYCLMHMQNKPNTMQLSPKYEDVSLEVLEFLKEKLADLHSAGIHDVVVDPGFGFGKTIENNYKLLNDLEVFKILNRPIMIGISRKSMIYKPLEIEIEETLPASTALHLYGLQKGANILRVHDVAEARQVRRLFELLTN